MVLVAFTKVHMSTLKLELKGKFFIIQRMFLLNNWANQVHF